jgi:WG containing repeat
MYGLDFGESLAPVQIGKGWGYIDTSGRTVLTIPLARRAHPFGDGLAGVLIVPSAEVSEDEGRWGFIDRAGKFVIKPQFDEVYGFSEGLGRVVVNRKWGFIDRQGKFVVEPQFKGAYWFSEGFASVALENDQRVFIDHSGRIASPPHYQFTDSWFSEGLTPYGDGGKWGFIDTHWQPVIKAEFNGVAQAFSDGVVAVTAGNLWGVIDRSGKMILGPQFKKPISFHEGLASVRIGDKYGYIDKTGKVVIEAQFAQANDFRGGLASVTRNPNVHRVQCCWRYWDYIDRTGKVVWKSPDP